MILLEGDSSFSAQVFSFCFVTKRECGKFYHENRYQQPTHIAPYSSSASSSSYPQSHPRQSTTPSSIPNLSRLNSITSATVIFFGNTNTFPPHNGRHRRWHRHICIPQRVLEHNRFCMRMERHVIWQIIRIYHNLQRKPERRR